ncbi:YicC/YloC family endoribonuclease [Algoriphagus sp. AK58]|uniref:YicC/YloC family endoribonuclease n=1 Tax=Algoriphagus sp. AK58 TaxID=1406877 RepID=UPI00164FC563|nr:YicC/YloC family endoribonuclease [Algoriphagus sp. AK58]MBC6366633.1 YicC family protein [Algoriphagus sp. AK58]
MIKSMTGFGVAGFENEHMVIQVEVRSLNSKFLDLAVRSPRQFSDKEPEIRNLVQSVLDRGKVSISIEFVAKGVQNLPVSINEDLFKTYFLEFKRLAESVGEVSTDLFKLSLQAPNVMISVPIDREESEDWEQVKLVLEEALKKCDNFRKDEGASLFQKLKENIEIIRTGLSKIKADESNRKEKIQTRIRGHFSQWMDENSFDANRFEQELIYYFEKIDITEEIVRLETHLDYFLKSMDQEVNQGKKLGFISQEIGREINTIGSKANDAEIQKHVILMKDELEKIKEQSLNVL